MPMAAPITLFMSQKQPTFSHASSSASSFGKTVAAMNTTLRLHHGTQDWTCPAAGVFPFDTQYRHSLTSAAVHDGRASLRRGLLQRAHGGDQVAQRARAGGNAMVRPGMVVE